MADQAAAQADPVAAAQALAARSKAARVLADRTAARARFFEASEQAALASVRSLPGGADGAVQDDVAPGNDASSSSDVDGGSGDPNLSTDELTAADQGHISLGGTNDQPLGERVAAPVVGPGGDRPLAERIDRPVPVVPAARQGRRSKFSHHSTALLKSHFANTSGF